MFFTDPALHYKLGLYLIISLILISSIGNDEAQMMGRGLFKIPHLFELIRNIILCLLTF